jgi:hypothetical protein
VPATLLGENNAFFFRDARDFGILRISEIRKYKHKHKNTNTRSARAYTQDSTQNFALCLEGTADATPGDHFLAFLQQPCTVRSITSGELTVRSNMCEEYKCWGLLQVCR